MAVTGGRTSTTGRTGHLVPRAVAGAVGVFFLAAGGMAFLAPAAFFEAAATFEPYSEHLVRDIGAFQVGVGAVLILSVWVGDGLVVALGGVGAGSLVHAVGHVVDRDRGGTPAIDIPFFAAVAVLLIVVAVLRWRAIVQGRDE